MNYCYQHSQSLDQPESIKHTRFLQKQNNLKYPSSLKLSIILDNKHPLHPLYPIDADKDEASGTAITVYHSQFNQILDTSEHLTYENRPNIKLGINKCTV